MSSGMDSRNFTGERVAPARATEETKPVEREAFEKWARAWFDGEGEDPIFFDPAEECYSHHAVHSSWMAWQASADAALERVLEYIPTVTGPTGGWLVSPKTVENAVEALKGSR